ncbi:hypothetical protein [Amycolatopsis sacchari]|uniref:Uncharacterized protein n=1 Tax=Amycolatopsis sacchari TaxID=115433 RepID=A0A1I3SKK0_9PSEU|nr:hypothetical protein [Amycolatopsis sacchari]SFJ57976.1 hypothetical protein SAMN05421835_106325 [Amycolatopsis sacchari]
MTDEDELDAELRRLFADERLDVRPRDDAPATILAGARRVRARRRALTATGGALTAVVLVALGLVLGQVRAPHTDTAAPVRQPTSSGSAFPSADSPSPSVVEPGSSVAGREPGTASGSTALESPGRTSSVSSPASTSVPRSQSVQTLTAPVLGPEGYGKLALGMPFDVAVRTGMLERTAAPPEPCGTYALAEGAAGIRTVTISDTRGIVGFEASGARTPERIGLGSDKDDLEAAYPKLVETANGYTVPAGPSSNYVFLLDDRDRVAALLLVGPATC